VSRPVELRDLSALIGILAICKSEIMLMEPAGRMLARRFATRLSDEGLLGANATERDVRQAVNDLNQRLRFALGEYDQPPEPLPVPEG